MQSLIRQSRKMCYRIVHNNVFFEKLNAGGLDDLMFVYQLRLWCGEFIDSLFIAAGMTDDPAFKKVRRHHAMEEGKHPDQLDRWMAEHDLTQPLPHMTNEGEILSGFVRDVAIRGSDPIRVLVLNVFMEYMALVTFQALIKHFTPAVLNGPYWHEHEEVDENHSMYGTNLVSAEWLDANRGTAEQMIERATNLMDKWFTSIAA